MPLEVGVFMAGRPIKEDKKIREAIYFEPELLAWVEEKAEKQKCSTSVIVNLLVEKEKNLELKNSVTESDSVK